MKKILIILVLFVSFSCVSVDAKQGCCSGHGGVAYCGANGHYYCKDDEPSPSCTCGEPDYTTYEEDAANGDLYYEDDDSANSEGGRILGYIDKDGKLIQFDDSTSMTADAKGIFNADDIEKYMGVGALLLVLTGGSYSVGKHIGKKS